MALPKVVADWVPIMGPLKVTGAEYQTWDEHEIQSFNAWLQDKRAQENYTVERNEDTFIFTLVRDAGAGHVFSGAPDARQAATSPAPEGGPFRRRYRKLDDAEAKYRDLIKDTASELWKLIDELPAARSAPDPTVGRDIALAKTHLEDSVMRAVRALTA